MNKFNKKINFSLRSLWALRDINFLLRLCLAVSSAGSARYKFFAVALPRYVLSALGPNKRDKRDKPNR